MSEPKSRRRGAELEQAILEATWHELQEVGYNRLTIEAVAARAATSKPVIYRRWANRATLVLAAWHQRSPSFEVETRPDTGSLRGDLLDLFDVVGKRVAGLMNEMIAGVMGEAFRHPEVQVILRKRFSTNSPLAEPLTAILDRAVRRGEIAEFALTLRVARLPFDLVRHESMAGMTEPTPEMLEQLVDEVYLPLLRGLALSPA
ncbi:AcrR family transcriptional regulator [Crossiella equi]|uniref:AcrR family transcriptional regulator n=1 Tax=Crossiella equi TaxID=130796 RepID=A0ABS5A576_9PSEU|nr:TetR/AcrR family transcriptional regulator [Crossiella equi]MBP2471736.1 AcrR family transcriptional regulator [Crossiella equi]